MPHYFVEGYRDGKPTPALYVQADNPDAAVARAAQLKMQEVTGVRLAKGASPQSPLSNVRLLLIVTAMLSGVMKSCSRQSAGTSLAPAIFLTLLISIPFILILYLVLIKPYRQKLKMQAEIDELRVQPRSGTGVNQ